MTKTACTSDRGLVAEMFHTCRPGILIAVSSFFLLQTAWAQTNRLTGPVDLSRTTALKGNVNPGARPEFDAGPVDPSFAMSYMTLAFAPSDAQTAALKKLLDDQQDPASPEYRKWITPEQYADRFGLSRDDLAQALAWLRTAGFTVVNTAHARNWIAFSGTAGQVQQAFRTEIHRYNSPGAVHTANSSEPVVPADLAPLVSGFLGLDDFSMTPPRHSPLSGLHPDYTFGTAHALAPDDLAAIYDLTPLYKTGFDGTGQSIAITGQSKILLSDIQAFRKQYGLPAKDPQLVLVLGAADPGIVPASQLEASLDVEWAGAVARNANIIYVYSGTIGLSALYAVDLNVAPVVSTSASLCESLASTKEFSRQTALQASAQGITWLTSSGDSGAANCDDGTSAAKASHGLSVSIWAANPNITAVGGTTFNDATGNYWNSVNSSTRGSALSYIPEQAWNATSGDGFLAASGGGISTIFARPSWQVGPGVPAGNFRLVPDVSLAAAGHTPYLIVNNGIDDISAGTSASAPAFAGLIGILNQYQIAKGFQTLSGQGNINPVLYRLAQSTPTAFHDITTGNNIIPCASGTVGCTTGSYGYSAGPGYDLVTGLGSVDGNNLITQWNNSILNTMVTLTANTATFNRTDSTQLTATVTTIGSASNPATGSVTFSIGPKTLGKVAVTASGGSEVANLSITGNHFSVGPQTVTATYVPGAGFTGSTAGIGITVGSGTAPVVDFGGVVPVYSTVSTISTGSWISIYGTNLAAAPVSWNGDFPTKLGGVTVTVNGNLAYLWFVSPTQINLQAPDDTTTGTVTVNVVVTNEKGSFSSAVTLAPVSPSFSVLDGTHVTGIILRSDGSGAYGAGVYDIVGPTGTSLGYKTVAAKAGDDIILFGVGFGPTNPLVPAGQVYSGAAATANPVSFLFNSAAVVPSFAGLSSAGLYQFNFKVPAGLGTGDVPLVAAVASASTLAGVVISLQ